jgi:glycosyltransferase involved in cell wall biosynthesis
VSDLYVTQILDNEELEREKSVRGRAKVINEFTWSAVVDRLEGIYGSFADVS